MDDVLFERYKKWLSMREFLRMHGDLDERFHTKKAQQVERYFIMKKSGFDNDILALHKDESLHDEFIRTGTIPEVRKPTLQVVDEGKVFLYRYGEFSSTIASNRTNDNHELICASLLEHAAMGDLMRHKAFPRSTLSLIMKEGYNIEGFASSFSFQMGLIDKTSLYCSISEIDEQYLGSMGSFFKNTFDNRKVFLNPPRITELLPKIFDHCMTCVEKGAQFKIVLYGDDDCQVLNEHDLCQYLQSLIPLSIKSEDPFTGTRVHVPISCFMYTIHK